MLSPKSKATTPATTKIIRDPAFGKRLEQAAAQHPHCPPKGRGRLRWVSEQMAAKGEPVSNETVRKWFEGEVKPENDRGVRLAEVFGVDASWLTLGIDVHERPRERKIRNAMADGAVNLVAGMIQLDGGHPAFPEGEAGPVDIHAIIRGAKYDFHVSLGEVTGRKAKFVVPAMLDGVIVIGVIRDGFVYDLFEVTPEVIEEYGTNHGHSIEVDVDGAKLRRIESFATRL